MEEAGFALDLFDFRLPGVTSISCDTHKYGYAPKGTSVILYRSHEYLHHQYFSVTDWTGGIYATPTLAGINSISVSFLTQSNSGSRSGLAIALTWATMVYFGRNVYVSRARAIVDSARELAKQIATVPGLEIYGSPDVSVVAFRSKELNIYAVADKLNHLGWNLNTLQNPDSYARLFCCLFLFVSFFRIHFCMTFNQANGDVISSFMTDLRKACEEVCAMPNKGGASKTAAIYGTAAMIPDRSLVSSMTHVFLDACYSMPEKVEQH